MSEKKKKPRFVRKDTFKKSRLGKRRKKKQKWRRARGRHSKIRLKRRGYGKKPSIGYGTERKIKATIKGLQSRLIYSVGELKNIEKNEIIIIGKVGKKKKIEIAKEAMKQKLDIYNLNIKTFLKKIEKEKKELEKKKEKSKEKEKKQEKKEETSKEKEMKIEKEKEKEMKKEKPKVKDKEKPEVK